MCLHNINTHMLMCIYFAGENKCFKHEQNLNFKNYKYLFKEIRKTVHFFFSSGRGFQRL